MKRVLKLVSATLLVWPILMFIEAKRNILKRETVRLPNLPENFRNKNILFISDVHTRVIPQYFIDTFKHEISLVIIGGDLLERGVPATRVRKNIQRLKQAGNVIFVWGNNDLEEKKQLADLLQEENVISLENEIYQWGVNGQVIHIAGLGDRNGKSNEYVTSFLDEQTTAILVTHDPADLKKLNSPWTVDFALAGHTHGGQIRLGGYGISEKGGWTGKYGIPLLISNGYGTSTLPLRWEAPPEVHVITLEKSIDNRDEIH